MGGRPISWRESVAVVGFAMVAFCLILVAHTAFGGHLPFSAAGYRFKVAFPDARTLVANADVRIAGVPVGKVVKVSAGEDKTVALVELKERYAPLPQDARAILRTKTPLGESYVEITRGTPTAPKLKEGAELATQNVQATQQVEQALSAFDAPTRKAFRQLVTEAAASLQGRGPDINAALGASGPAVDDLAQVVDAVDAQSKNVQTLVRQTGAALRAVGSRPQDLQSLVRSGDTVLRATAARSAQLTATTRALSDFVVALRPAAVDISHSLDLAAPTIKALRGVAPLLAPALRSADGFAPAATRVFRGLRPVLSDAKRATGPTVKLLNASLPLSRQLDYNGRQAVPLLQLLDAYKRDIVLNIGSGAASFGYVKAAGGGTYHTAARAGITFTTDGGVGTSDKRPGNSRFNAYPPPGSQGDRKSYSCQQTKNAASGPGDQVPCIVEPGWSFRGAAQQFPKLTPYMPPGVKGSK